MSIQNRITPFGCVIAHTARGLFTGNRGVIHNSATKQLHPTRRWTSKAWIYCLCEFKGRKRDVFGANGPNGSPGWTNLFFLDEATALSAGHRPCFYCQRERAKAFQNAYSVGNQMQLQKAPQIDAMLHNQRLNGRKKRRHAVDGQWSALPNGVMLARGEEALLVCEKKLHPWRPDGYLPPVVVDDDLELLTPPAIVAAIKAGFAPQISLR